MTGPAEPRPTGRTWSARHLLALLTANFALAFGPWSVRLADSGPIAAAFWRLALPLPLLLILARANRQRLAGFGRGPSLAVAAAAVMFAADLAAWHLGIGLTRLGNATLFGNAGSLVVMVWGVAAARRAPTRAEALALLAALAGAAILFGRSLEVGRATLAGDLLCVLAGLFYAGYIIVLQHTRAGLAGTELGNWALLVWCCLIGAPLLLATAAWHGEPVWPHRWWPLFTLALGSQVIGQGLLVYSLRHFRALVIGLVLLTQPALSVLLGWLAFGERLSGWDGLGMALVAAALVIARAAPPVQAQSAQ